MAKKVKKQKPDKIDGLSPEDIARIRIAIRQVWSWSYPRKLCLKRCTKEDGFSYCEKCKVMCPKIKIDHIVAVGDVNAGFIKRLFCPSSGLMALCSDCHNLKTREERKNAK